MGTRTPCEVAQCGRHARGVGDQPRRCKRHGGGHRCATPGCTRSAREDGTATTRCRLHGGGKRCVECGASVRTRGTTCRRHTAPSPPSSPWTDSIVRLGKLERERYTNAALDAWGDEIRDASVLRRLGKRVLGTRFMPDWSALVMTTTEGRLLTRYEASSAIGKADLHLVVETDEGAHRSESAAAHHQRMLELARAMQTERPTSHGVLFVRFNPDECNVWKERQDVRVRSLVNRLLSACVTSLVSSDGASGLHVVYAYYPRHSKHVTMARYEAQCCTVIDSAPEFSSMYTFAAASM